MSPFGVCCGAAVLSALCADAAATAPPRRGGDVINEDDCGTTFPVVDIVIVVAVTGIAGVVTVVVEVLDGEMLCWDFLEEKAESLVLTLTG